jgi:hypothetical protein
VDLLERIIENLTSDEVRRFKILSNRFKAEDEKKLLILFDAIRAGGYDEVEDDLITQLYGNTDARAKNNYYRLRNKLLSNLEKSLLFYHFNYKNSLESFSHIQLSILLRERGLYREAYYYLRKAEKIADHYDQFNVLEVIYDEMIQLASKDVEIEVEAIISQRRANQEKIEAIRQSSEVLGVISQQLKKRNFSRGKSSNSVIEMLESIRASLEEHKGLFHSASGKIMIFKTVSAILLQKGAYDELESYVKETFDDFDALGLFDKETHTIKLLMRIWRINALQKLLRLSEAAEEIAFLAEDLEMFKRRNYNEYAFYYVKAEINNRKFLGELDDAGAMLKEVLSNKDIVRNESNELYLLISLADQYFNQGVFAGAAETLRKIYAHKGFPTMDEELRFFVHIFEMVNGFEARNYELVEGRFRKFKKRFKHLLKDEYYAGAKKFIEILLRMNQAAIEGKKVFLKSALKNFVESFGTSEIGDNQIIQYDLYLRSRLEEVRYYDLVLKEIRKKSK